MVVNCLSKDNSGLNDFQKLPAEDGIAIPRVGINRFRIPIKFYHKDEKIERSHDCTASMYVNLKAGKTGINMSRLCQILTQETESHTLDYPFLTKIINRVRSELRDYPHEKEFKNAYISIDFTYPLKQKSLKSENWGWQYYKCNLETKVCEDDNIRHYLTVHYEYSSTCPCSLSMAKQYEKDFQENKTTEGVGLGVAHSQRSQVKCKIELSQNGINQNFFIEDLIYLLRKAIPTETQSLVKRLDEQAFAILNGENPMFVEHASKRLYQELNKSHFIHDWVCEIEHWESLHSHNAAALIYKGLPDGLRLA
ncbi:MAG: GTP cyclohydrolase I FolE2 [Halobacteriovoraceae bacterium]|nr:GTP cyclohydrolase I FolE2 [Halobacteriovoraceae bacterium]